MRCNEEVRRDLAQEINDHMFVLKGQTWTTDQLRAEFIVEGFLAPLVVVTRKSTGERGSLAFTHNPRLYFGWSPFEP